VRRCALGKGLADKTKWGSRVTDQAETAQKAGVTAGEFGQPEAQQTSRSRLTPREREIVQLLAEGKSSKEVGVALGISVKTAETHRANIMRKLGIHSVTELVRYAVKNQIIEA